MRDEITVRQDGSRVLLISNGRLVAIMPHDAALALAAAIRHQGKKAEEWANAESIVYDQAILQRLGVPFGLTDNPILQREAGKEAAWNSDLRRYLPGGIRSQETFGTPTIKRHKPTGDNNGKASEKHE